MGRVDFAASMKQAEESGMVGGGADTYKYKEGDNRIRLLSECLPHQSTYQGKTNFKWLCYVLDRRDGKVKVHFMPHVVYKAIAALQANPDYAFSEVPMPYDVTIHAKNAGTKDVEYTLLPARRETPLTPDELNEFSSHKALPDVQERLKEKEREKQAESHPVQPTRRVSTSVELNDDDIPF